MDFLSVPQFAAARRVSPARVAYWLRHGRLDGACKIGGRWIVPAAADPGVKAVGRPRKEQAFRLREEAMLDLCAAPPDLKAWRRAGPPRLMAGMAMLLASATGFDRARYLQLAEQLDPGLATLHGFARWLEETPYRPSRFLPQLRRRIALSTARDGHA